MELSFTLGLGVLGFVEVTLVWLLDEDVFMTMTLGGPVFIPGIAAGGDFRLILNESADLPGPIKEPPFIWPM